MLASGAFIEACINEFILAASRDDLSHCEGAEARTGLELFADCFFSSAGTTWMYENARDTLQP